MLSVLFDTSPLKTGHAIRGIGRYTSSLQAALQQTEEVTLVTEIADLPEIIHYPFFDLFLPTLPKPKSIPTVVTVHDVIPLRFKQHYPAGIKGSFYLEIQKRRLRQAAAVITDSEASKSDLIKYLGVQSNKIHVVYLAADADFKPVSRTTINSVRKKYHLPKHFILYVGDINYNKNIPLLIKTIKNLPESLSLVCVGKQFYPQDIPEWQAIAQQVALSNVAHRVSFLPNIVGPDSKDLVAIYTAAEMYVQPSRYEGFGLPVLEAMRCRTPVVATRNSSLIEISGGVAKLSDESWLGLQDSIEQVLKLNQTQKKRLIARAAQWASRFSWQKTARATVEVYQTCVK